MSLRATGEGHISSIVFRTGIIWADGDVRVDPAGSYSTSLKATVPDVFLKSTLQRDMAATGMTEAKFRPILDRLESRFTRDRARRGDRSRTSRATVVRRARRNRRHAHLAHPRQSSASPSPATAGLPRSRNRHLSVFRSRAARHRRPETRAIHRIRRQPHLLTEPSPPTTAAAPFRSCFSTRAVTRSTST